MEEFELDFVTYLIIRNNPDLSFEEAQKEAVKQIKEYRE